MRAASTAVALVALCSCTGDDGGASDPGSPVAKFCVSETNRYRAMVPVPDLTESTELETYAADGAEADTASGTPHSHFSSTSGGGIAFAENECPASLGWNIGPNPTDDDLIAKVGQCIAAFWSEGPGDDYSTHGHYINMTSANYHSVGCGVYVNGSQLTITQDFGQ